MKTPAGGGGPEGEPRRHVPRGHDVLKPPLNLEPLKANSKS